VYYYYVQSHSETNRLLLLYRPRTVQFEPSGCLKIQTKYMTTTKKRVAFGRFEELRYSRARDGAARRKTFIFLFSRVFPSSSREMVKLRTREFSTSARINIVESF